MFRSVVFVILLICTITKVNCFVSLSSNRLPRVKPVNENFFLDIAEDPAVNTPKEIFGEVSYKTFVEKYDPEALLVGGKKYNIIERVRALKLLSLTAESGLLEALEEKGLTLSQAEKLLPLVDELGLLPLLAKNKELVLAVAPLIIEPAPALLPIVVSVLKTPASSFTYTGLTFATVGTYELFDNALLGAPLLLLGLPLFVLGSVLSGSVSIPVPKKPEGILSIEEAPKPSADRPTVKADSSNNSLNGKRKVIKVKA
mmetsp:Transcript_13931/g.12633  ORF Transcript_13931/g.12633 Transcript_13931/m.12633 type:complete len:257 (-) Transcript_13931:61-831(-)